MLLLLCVGGCLINLLLPKRSPLQSQGLQLQMQAPACTYAHTTRGGTSVWREHVQTPMIIQHTALPKLYDCKQHPSLQTYPASSCRRARRCEASAATSCAGTMRERREKNLWLMVMLQLQLCCTAMSAKTASAGCAGCLLRAALTRHPCWKGGCSPSASHGCVSLYTALL